MRDGEYRVRDLATMVPGKAYVDCELCSARRALFCIEHQDDPILRRHLVCQHCRDTHGTESIILTLENTAHRTEVPTDGR